MLKRKKNIYIRELNRQYIFFPQVENNTNIHNNSYYRNTRMKYKFSINFKYYKINIIRMKLGFDS